MTKKNTAANKNTNVFTDLLPKNGPFVGLYLLFKGISGAKDMLKPIFGIERIFNSAEIESLKGLCEVSDYNALKALRILGRALELKSNKETEDGCWAMAQMINVRRHVVYADELCAFALFSKEADVKSVKIS